MTMTLEGRFDRVEDPFGPVPERPTAEQRQEDVRIPGPRGIGDARSERRFVRAA